MAERHEEKYLIDYRQYALLKARAGQVLTPDPHGQNGSYTITSLYYDDLKNTALLEKQDGLPVHTKFRLRTYDANADLIRLERKVKQGIMTQKQSAVILKDQLAFLGMPGWDLAKLSEDAQPLALQMLSGGMRPATAIRYRRDAFLFPGTDLRLTFDMGLEVLPPDILLPSFVRLVQPFGQYLIDSLPHQNLQGICYHYLLIPSGLPNKFF